MKPRALFFMLSFALGCAGETSVAQRELSTTYSITRSNVAEFDGKVSIPVLVETEDGMTRITIDTVAAWPVSNALLGFDKFLYNTSAEEHPIVRIQDEGCDELVVSGSACGWDVNSGTCQGDGFGCFASQMSADPASYGARTSPLVFYLAGEVELLPNDHGARLALHARFGEAPGSSIGCSGWFSDGEANSVSSEPGCEPIEARSCEIVVSPSSLSIRRGEARSASVEVAVSGPSPAPAVTLSLLPSPLPVGLAFTLLPNPLLPPGEALLTVQATERAAEGTTLLTIQGTAEDESGAQITCETQLSLLILEEPTLCGCP